MFNPAEHRRGEKTEGRTEYQETEAEIERRAIMQDPAVAFSKLLENHSSGVKHLFDRPEAVSNVSDENITKFNREIHYAFDTRNEHFPHDDQKTAEGVAAQLFKPMHDALNDQEYTRMMYEGNNFSVEQAARYRHAHYQLQMLEAGYADTLQSDGIANHGQALGYIMREGQHIAQNGYDESRTMTRYLTDVYSYDVGVKAEQHANIDPNFDANGAHSAVWVYSNWISRASETSLMENPTKEPSTQHAAQIAEQFGSMNGSMSANWKPDTIAARFPDLKPPEDYSKPEDVLNFIERAREHFNVNSDLKVAMGIETPQWQSQVMESGSAWASIYADTLQQHLDENAEDPSMIDRFRNLPGIGSASRILSGVFNRLAPEDHNASFDEQQSDEPQLEPIRGLNHDPFSMDLDDPLSRITVERYLKLYCHAIAYAANT